MSINSFFIGVDQGSSSTKVVVVSRDGEILFSDKLEVATVIRDAKVEQDAESIYEGVLHLLNGALSYCSSGSKSIGFSWQRSSSLVWDISTLNSVSPLISWRDLRFSQRFSKLKPDQRSLIREKTGLIPSPNYAAFRIADFQRHFPDRRYVASTLDSFILAKLTKSKAILTDYSMAARTMLFSKIDCEWSTELCKIFAVDASRLPVVTPTVSDFGTYSSVPIIASIGDQQAALYGAKLLGFQGLINLGTLASILVSNQIVTESKYIDALFYMAKGQQPRMMTEAVIPTFGGILDLLPDVLRIPLSNELDTLLSQTFVDHEVVLYAPRKAGGTPDWDFDRDFVLTHRPKQFLTKSQAAKLLVESTIFAISYNLEGLQSEGVLEIGAKLLVAGGGAGSDYILSGIQLLTGVSLFRDGFHNLSALGAALIGSGESSATAAIRDLKPVNSDLEFCKLDQRYKAWKSINHNVLSGVGMDQAEFFAFIGN